MLDALKVDIYGDRVALKAVGSVSVRDSQMLSVSPFDPQVPFSWHTTKMTCVKAHAGVCGDLSGHVPSRLEEVCALDAEHARLVHRH